MRKTMSEEGEEEGEGERGDVNGSEEGDRGKWE